MTFPANDVVIRERLDEDRFRMPRELEKAVVGLVTEALGAELGETPTWLIRPGRAESGRRWPMIKAIYGDLTGLELPDVMRSVERRTVDAVLLCDGELPRILEVDEKQHFNGFRAITLRRYMKDVPLAFDPRLWLERSEAKRRLEGGGFAAPKPPLFPGNGGRHRQRAFRDALCDILPTEHGFAPTLRIAHFEVEGWLWAHGAQTKMASLLEERLHAHASSS